jgi:hypothetical protein
VLASPKPRRVERRRQNPPRLRFSDSLRHFFWSYFFFSGAGGLWLFSLPWEGYPDTDAADVMAEDGGWVRWVAGAGVVGGAAALAEAAGAEALGDLAEGHRGAAEQEAAGSSEAPWTEIRICMSLSPA